MRHYMLMSVLIAALFVAVTGTACSRQEAKAPNKEELLAKAEEDRLHNQFDTAEKNFRAVLRLSSQDAVAVRGLALLYSEQGQWPLAIPFLKQAAELKPDDPEIQEKLGVAYLLTRDFKLAREAALKALERAPGQEDAAILLADTADNTAAIDEVRTALDTLLQKNGDHSGYRVAQGVLEVRQGNDSAAEQRFQEALRLDPNSAGALSALATLYFKRKDLKAADSALRTVAELVPPHYAATIRYAEFLLATQSPDRAKDLLEKLSEKVPSYLPARVTLMKIVCTAKQDDACVSRVQNVLSQDPINFDALLISGNLSLEKNDPTAAIRSFDQALKLSGQSPQLLYSLSRAYLMVAQTVDAVNARKYVESAEGFLNSALQLAPAYDQAALLLADLKIRKGSGAAAVDLLKPVISRRRQAAEAYGMLGAAYLSQQDAGNALDAYRSMADLLPNNPLPEHAIGAILISLGKLSEAREALEKALVISPDFGPAMELLVNLDAQEGNFDPALLRIKQQLDKNPSLAQWWGLSGKIKLAKHDFAGAEQDLTKALEINPELELAQTLLARTYVMTKQPEMAIKMLTDSVNRKKAVAPLLALATLQEQQKNFPAAREAYESALSLQPGNVIALNNLAVVYSDQGELDKAFELAKRAHDAASGDSRISDTLGWIQFKKHQYREAFVLLRDSASKNPDDLDIQFHYGMAAYMTGDEGTALSAFRNVAQSSNEARSKLESQRRIDFLSLGAGETGPNETQIRSFLKDYPDDPVALSRLSEIALKRDDIDGAIQGYEKILANYQEFAPATRQLTLLYARKGSSTSKAMEVAAQARLHFPNDAEIAKAIGILQYRAANYPRATELLKEATAKRPEDAAAFYFLGKSYHDLKDLGQCKLALERAVSLSLEPSLVADATSAIADCTEPQQ